MQIRNAVHQSASVCSVKHQGVARPQHTEMLGQAPLPVLCLHCHLVAPAVVPTSSHAKRRPIAMGSGQGSLPPGKNKQTNEPPQNVRFSCVIQTIPITWELFSFLDYTNLSRISKLSVVFPTPDCSRMGCREGAGKAVELQGALKLFYTFGHRRELAFAGTGQNPSVYHIQSFNLLSFKNLQKASKQTLH